MYLSKKSFRNNDLPTCGGLIGITRTLSSVYAGAKHFAQRSMACLHLMRVSDVNICDYFFLQGLVTWLDTPILSRTIQEVIDARQLV